MSGKSWNLNSARMLIGYFLVTAEPAVHVLNRQVEMITNGGISQRAMMLSLSIGVACSVGLAMMRVLTGISIYYILIPGYLIALTLTFLCRRYLPALRSTRAASRPADDNDLPAALLDGRLRSARREPC